MPNRITAIQGDITALPVDAIVNAANGSLRGGGGVDGAIHLAAGPELYEECVKLKGCATGEAKITHGYKLPATWIIHTVGPIWNDGQRREPEKLAKCYNSCLKLAAEHNLRSIAFPAISTGAYGFPADQAARIAIRETAQFLRSNTSLNVVIFCCFNQQMLETYEEALKELFPQT